MSRRTGAKSFTVELMKIVSRCTWITLPVR